MKQFIKCPECGEVQLALKEGGMYFRCKTCNKIQHNFPESIKALSIKQPWAWLIVNGHKDIENRDTLKNFRGTFLIHAGKTYDSSWVDDPKFYELVDSHTFMHLNEFRYGGIIGYAEIYDCVTKSDSPWFVGKNGLMLRNPKPLPFTPCKGKLSFFYPEID